MYWLCSGRFNVADWRDDAAAVDAVITLLLVDIISCWLQKYSVLQYNSDAVLIGKS